MEKKKKAIGSGAGVVRKGNRVKVRACNWGDVEGGRILYGIEVRIGGGEWAYAAQGGRALIFEREERRDEVMKELRKSGGEEWEEIASPV